MVVFRREGNKGGGREMKKRKKKREFGFRKLEACAGRQKYPERYGWVGRFKRGVGWLVG